jgi:glycosyltransferase involved in cell wall biosynthesis
MAEISPRVRRLGIPYLRRLPRDLRYWLKRERPATTWMLKNIPPRKWASLEVGGENLWAFFTGFTLARLFEEAGIEHIHSSWANGPATAAWVASKLTGLPFSFDGRAHDIHPPDGALEEKIRDSAFVRVNNDVNRRHLAALAPEFEDKIKLVYNGHTLRSVKEARVEMRPPYKIRALGRLARTKGYDVLLKACKIMLDSGIDLELTIGGAGPRGQALKTLTMELGLEEKVSFPGFITHDKVSEFLSNTDVFVMPSVIHKSGERDGIPNVIMEALLHRVPVVASDISAIGEVVIDDQTGYLVPQRDPESLARAVRRMTEDREKALALAQNGKDLVMSRFDPKQNSAMMLELFREHS